MSTRKTPKDQAKPKQQHQQLQVPKSNGSSNNSSKIKLDKKGNSSELNKSNSSSTHHEKKPKIEVRERNQNSKKSKPKILPINLLFGLAAGSLFTTLAAADLSADLFALETNTLDFIPQYLAWRSTAPYMASFVGYFGLSLLPFGLYGTFTQGVIGFFTERGTSLRHLIDVLEFFSLIINFPISTFITVPLQNQLVEKSLAPTFEIVESLLFLHIISFICNFLLFSLPIFKYLEGSGTLPHPVREKKRN